MSLDGSSELGMEIRFTTTRLACPTRPRTNSTPTATPRNTGVELSFATTSVRFRISPLLSHDFRENRSLSDHRKKHDLISSFVFSINSVTRLSPPLSAKGEKTESYEFLIVLEGE